MVIGHVYHILTNYYNISYPFVRTS